MVSDSILSARARAMVRNHGGEYEDYMQEAELRILQLSHRLPAELWPEYREWLVRKTPSRFLFLPRPDAEKIPECPWRERRYVVDALPAWVVQYASLVAANGSLAELWPELGSPMFVMRNRTNLETSLISAIVDDESVCQFVAFYLV